MELKCLCKTKGKYHAKDCPSFVLNKYIKIKEEAGYVFLTPEDMLWIDENVKEDPTVTS